MAISQKQRKQLKLAQKRRARRPEPRIIVDTKPLTVKPRERERFTNQAPRLLYAVETALQSAFRVDSQLDDQMISEAVACAIRGRQTESETLSQVLLQLAIAAEESGASQENWQTALRVVYTSIRTHYDGRPGSRNYLMYAKEFLAQIG